MRHTLILTIDADGRYDSPRGQQELCDLMVGRAWNINGVAPHGATGFMKSEAVVHTRAEYDGMRQALRDRDIRIGELETQNEAFRKAITEMTADIERLSRERAGQVGRFG